MLRIKQRPSGIDYESLDPFVQVQCGSTAKETSVLVGDVHSVTCALYLCIQLRPEWNQELQLTLKLPSANFSEVQYWLQQQELTFHLFDYEVSGPTPYGAICRLSIYGMLATVCGSEAPLYHWQLFLNKQVELVV